MQADRVVEFLQFTRFFRQLLETVNYRLSNQRDVLAPVAFFVSLFVYEQAGVDTANGKGFQSGAQLQNVIG